MNELIIVAEVIVVFGLLLIFKKKFGKEGLLSWVAIATLLANLQVSKNINLFGLETALGNVLFASNFLATDILIECYGKKEANKAVRLGLFSTVAYLLITQLSLLYTPNSIDVASSAMDTLFGLSPRICLSSIAMYFISNIMSVHIYSKIKAATKGKYMWLRNNVTTIVCNCLENFAFAFFAFSGIYPFSSIISIALTGSIIEIIIALCDTPFLYWATRKERGAK